MDGLCEDPFVLVVDWCFGVLIPGDVDDEEMPDAFHASLDDLIVQMSLLTLSLSLSLIISNSQARANYGSTFIASPCG